jgi:hypothetical protein
MYNASYMFLQCSRSLAAPVSPTEASRTKASNASRTKASRNKASRTKARELAPAEAGRAGLSYS